MKNNNNFFVFCVIGQPGSGKDTLANFIEKESNFTNISTGNIIREEMKKSGIPTNRENMRLFSEKRRKEVGNNYPVNIVLEMITGNTVISGPRNCAEIEILKNKFGKKFMLVVVDAPIEVRHERIKNGRNREGDEISFADFKKQEEAEYDSGTHELNKLLSIADCIIDNSGEKEKMFIEMDRILEFTRK